MKFLFGSFLTIALCGNATAAHFSLIKVEPAAYEVGIEKIQAAIAADDTKQAVFQFDHSQSFLLTGRNQNRLGHLIPVKFNSKSYKNTICRLYFLDSHGELSFAELFAEKNDEDDIVSSCAGIEAASIRDKSIDEALYLAVVRHRTVNTYGRSASVLSYKNGALFYDKKINNCVNANGETTSIRSLKKKLLSCM